MVAFTPFVLAALFSGLAAARPVPDGHLANEANHGSTNSYETSYGSVEAPSSYGSVEAPSSYGSVEAPTYGSVEAPTYGSVEAPTYGSVEAPSSHGSVEAPSSYGSVVAPEVSTPQYGSGKSSWVGGEYDECVQSCIAKYPSKPVEWQATTTAGHGGATPTATGGATHTVIVAPQQGVLRYIPFAVNASIGDVIHFKWGANNHTVTQGSALLPCNRSQDADAFTPSGLQQKDFEFTQVVNSTEPTYFYCAAPTHCQKGMFGIINPPTDTVNNIGKMMGEAVKQDQDMAAKWSWAHNKTEGNEKASKWGYGINYSQLPEWSHKYVADNVLYTQVFLAENPEIMTESGSINLSQAGETPLLIPNDFATEINNAGVAPATEVSSPAADIPAAAPSPSASDAAVSDDLDSGAASLASPKAMVALVALAATFFAL